MQQYKFNPLTGELEMVTKPIPVTFKKSYTIVDAAFIAPRKVTLDAAPALDSEYVFFNGLMLDDACYNISTNELTFIPGLDIRVGDTIQIRYAI